MDDEQMRRAVDAHRTRLHGWGLRTQPEIEAATVRTGVWYGALPALAGIPVAAAHDAPLWLAVPLGVLDAVAIVLLGLRWNPQNAWRWYALGALTVVTFWPALVWWPWVALAATFAVIPLLLWVVSVLGRRDERRQALDPDRKPRLTRGMRKALAKSLGEQPH